MSTKKGKGTKRARPQMLVGARTVETVTFQSKRKDRITTRRTVVDEQVAGPSSVPFSFEEDLATQFARASLDFSYGLGDNSLDSQPEEYIGGLGIEVQVGAPRNKNSDRPLQTWVADGGPDEYLKESLRREGRGAPNVYARCAGVHCVDPERTCPNRVCSRPAEYRCCDAVCMGEVMCCATCIVASHVHLPTHFVEKWNGKCFER
ncbi:hypothetical protein DFH06DRAFT_1326234 [Mycena polygramma]|nr:hypothetical protein DFH06DRAFT_1326234 [Mycena polygramma]